MPIEQPIAWTGELGTLTLRFSERFRLWLRREFDDNYEHEHWLLNVCINDYAGHIVEDEPLTLEAAADDEAAAKREALAVARKMFEAALAGIAAAEKVL